MGGGGWRQREVGAGGSVEVKSVQNATQGPFIATLARSSLVQVVRRVTLAVAGSKEIALGDPELGDPERGSKTSLHTSPSWGRVARGQLSAALVEPDQSIPGGLATPKRVGACVAPAGVPPTNRPLRSGPGGRWGSVVFGWRALAHPVSCLF